RLYGFRRAGINRLSLGVQSLNDKFLRIIGREHDSAQARVAIEQALCAGFGRVNIDLMYGLPGQSTEEALEDLAAAGRFNLNHLSWYELTIEPNTAFGWRPPAGLPDEEKSLAMREAGHAFLHAAGLNSYEVSAWAGSPDDRCRHNLNYWNYGDYIGIGAGAHGKLTLSDTGQVLRSRKTRSPLSYMKQCLDVTATTDEGSLDTLAEESHELVDPERACDEFLLNALRLTDGFSLDVWQQRTRTNAQVLIDATADLVKSGHLRLENNRLAATTTAAAMLDEIIADVCILVDSSRAGHPGTAPKRTDTTTTGNGNATTGRTDTTTTGNGNATTGRTDTVTT
nr:radical SAM protein [Gammaproteobacteria bacterium]